MPMNKIKPNVKLIEVEGNEEDTQEDIQPIPDSGTGWPKSKFEICFGYNSENMHFWPCVGKAKMCLGGVGLFWKIVNKQLKIVNK